MELAPSTNFTPTKDDRPVMPPPLPVMLVTIEDARLTAAAGLECELDAFYVGLLQFEREAKDEGIVYKAENFKLFIEVEEGPVLRDDMRMLGVVVKSLPDLMRKFREVEIEFSRERGLTAGDERLVLLDPAGNWLRIMQSKLIV